MPQACQRGLVEPAEFLVTTKSGELMLCTKHALEVVQSEPASMSPYRETPPDTRKFYPGKNTGKLGYACPECSDVFTGDPTEVTLFALTGDDVYYDQEDYCTGFKSITAFRCGDNCYFTSPFDTGEVWECSDCESQYIGEADASTCCVDSD